MVWRQLPKLVPAGSIPVSCSIRLSLLRKPFFFSVKTGRAPRMVMRGALRQQRSSYTKNSYSRKIKFSGMKRDKNPPSQKVPLFKKIFFDTKRCQNLPAHKKGSCSVPKVARTRIVKALRLPQDVLA